ncbi:PQQ-binding-like beta-propeller repeat protein [Natronococcus sp. A-GB1]|uniref:outer membrane protein assembly factor BamB family protein n=1 Tax=Natronococcus sp. A-GB1 TaxID=3037648 RepID=UPI00241D3247|nr:PQQ-binding-like beta-propeller repeat protein [Natronococcus sp. A-GB1]MDG5758055.1 PQQ-binding-like beta-propeller repeat protein [Natronococcus sp. A-GB1]
MTWRRRSVLTTGAAFAAGGVLSSTVSGDGDGDADDNDLPDPAIEPNPETDAVWPSFDGDAGHARYAAGAPEFDGEALEVAWTFERATGEAAVVDGVVYASSPDGIVALDAADGSTIWEYTDADANRPSVVDDTVYVVDDELYALDAADGDVRWQTEIEPEDSTGTQTIAYGSAFVVADGTLYALDTDDGSVRWELESITAETQGSDDEEAEFEFRSTTAAANGVVYALAADDDGGARLALDPETGDEVWRAEYIQHDGFGIPRARATTTVVALGGVSHYARDVLDAQTGEEKGKARAEGIALVLGEAIHIGGYDGDALTATSVSDDADDWGVDVLRNVKHAAAIGGDTVYLHINDNAGTGDTTDADELDHSEYHDELVALNTDDGSEQWTISPDELPIGHVVAIDDETLYVEDDDNEGEGLVALREETDEDGQQEDDDGQEDSEDEEDGTDEDEREGPEEDGEDDGDNGDEDEDGDGDEDEQDDGSEEDDSGDEQDEDDEDPDDDDQGEPEGDGEDESEADDDEEPNGDDQEHDDEEESADDGDEEDDADEDDEQYGGEEGDEDEAERDDGAGDTDEDDGIGEEGDDETGDDDPNGDDEVESEDEPDADDEDDEADTDDDDDTDTETDDESDSVPGFTTGAGIAGGALGLEWLRRRAAADTSAESMNEKGESADEPTN